MQTRSLAFEGDFLTAFATKEKLQATRTKQKSYLFNVLCFARTKASLSKMCTLFGIVRSEKRGVLFVLFLYGNLAYVLIEVSITTKNVIILIRTFRGSRIMKMKKIIFNLISYLYFPARLTRTKTRARICNSEKRRNKSLNFYM